MRRFDGVALQLYDIAESQTGYFTATQAEIIGLSWERLSSNVKTGRFLRVAHGVYSPVTTVARTICDVAASNLPEEHVRKAIQEALDRGLVNREELLTQVERPCYKRCDV